MAKYIDAEKLIAEIERHRQAIRVLNEHTAPEQTSKTCAIFQYPDTILSELLSFIDSLQQEQTEVDFEQELYKHFGQVKDFTLGMRIGKYFYELGRKQVLQEIYDGKTKPVDKITAAWLDD